MTLASVQELLIQQQQKVQELAHELAAAKVLVPDPLGSRSALLGALLIYNVPRGLTLFFSCRIHKQGPTQSSQRKEAATVPSLLLRAPSSQDGGEAALCLRPLLWQLTPTLWRWPV